MGRRREEAVAAAGELVGALDDPSALVPQHPVIRDTVRRHPGLRLPRSRRLFEALLPAICEQKVTGVEARRSYRALIHAHGETIPGATGLWLAPTPATLAGLP